MLAAGSLGLYRALLPDVTPPGSDLVLAALNLGDKVHWDLTALFGPAFLLGRHGGAAFLQALYLPFLGMAVYSLMRRVGVSGLAAGVMAVAAPGLQLGIADGMGVGAFLSAAALWLGFVAVKTRQWALGLVAVLALAYAGDPQMAILWTMGAALAGFLIRQPILIWTVAAAELAWAWSQPRPKAEGREAAAFLERDAPAGAVVLSEAPVARAWTKRRIESEPAMLRIARSAYETQTMYSQERHIAVNDEPRSTYRLEQAGPVAEVEFFYKGQALGRSKDWRVRSLAGGRAAEAFDGLAVTATEGGLEVDFRGPVRFDEVVLLGQTGPMAKPRQGLRREAVVELKRRGVTHILTTQDSTLGGELHRNEQYWGVRVVGRREREWLFALE